jgi:hypothetical protein
MGFDERFQNICSNLKTTLDRDILRRFLCCRILLVMVLAHTAYSQQPSFPTNLPYFHTNTVNDLTNLEAATKAYRSGKMNKAEIMAITLATLNDEPIVFYGRMEDQLSNGVASTTVNFEIRVMNGIQSTVVRGTTLTDKNGYFTISGYHGQDLNLNPHKDGYVSTGSGGYFKYSRLEQNYFVPDPNQPTIVKMWKAQPEEPLVGIGKIYKLPYTNAPFCFDLIAQKIVSTGGDLKITIYRPPGIISGRNHQWWKVKFAVVDGGLIDASSVDGIPYFAPENGYQPSKLVSSTDRMPEGGVGGFRTTFYIMSRNGQVYSKLRVDFGINEKPDDLLYFEFSGIANTNHSRNWEAAPGTYLHPGY